MQNFRKLIFAWVEAVTIETSWLENSIGLSEQLLLSMNHKSYQPILPCGNKVLQKRWDDAYYEEHKRRVSSIYS